MAGLRDGLQRSRELYLPELDAPRDHTRVFPTSRQRSLPQQVGHIGFSIRSANEPSAWKRRFGRGNTAPSETALRLTRLRRCALLHGVSGVLLAATLTVLFLESMNGGWLWLLALAMLVAFCGVAAYWGADHFERLRLARWMILGGDLLVLMCAWLLLGSSLLFALLLPGMTLLALLLGGRREMVIAAFLAAAALVVVTIAALAGLPHLALHVPAAFTLLLNLLGALVCLGGMISGLLAVLARNGRVGAGDSWNSLEVANSAEIARVRIESDIHLRQLQDGIAALQTVLGRVEGGALHARVTNKEGELAPLATKLNNLLDRQERMFNEAQQHRRLEAAVGELIDMLAALHRGERVGWPAPTGTQVDRILALMRAPLTPRPLPRITKELPAVQGSSEPD